MSTTIRAYVLPAVTTVLGITAITGGVYALIKPLEAIKPFGLSPPPSSSTRPSTPQTSISISSHEEAFQISVIRAYGIRNVGLGLTILGLTALWKSSEEVVVKDAVRKCLGVALGMGAVVGFGDAWIVREFAMSEGVQGQEMKDAEKARRGHIGAALVILGVRLGLTMG
ncbi:hypothetical protein P280DRAFT_473414 [Massarina eburnea CBS 473.64]|uniref:Uncharacterized protein n=1 Tax=Massarina eburnea CBS 473.64 TaxID=1395130 RepID=A0A6A6RLM2_9PLEO|nr:hypothetical protein P280DRAFT_473414 [Massarina eburnea CBS 473.64]